MLLARGGRDAQAAWEDYALIGRWSSWSPQVRSVEASAERIAPGVAGTVHAPLGVRVRFRVTAVDEASRSWRWVVHAAGVSAGMEHRVLAVPGGCVTTLRIEAPAVLAAAYAPAALLALRRLVSPRRAAG
ncbi:SRPBCC family protein [Kineococcus vitellinus]|uniref:SRPBCC family protein n=1 Tax=Kineococcus vitellinus TaxID=2696565 RepID=UPI0014123EB7|nr:SRPBCC family protein [Kineococcus vitellinus]